MGVHLIRYQTCLLRFVLSGVSVLGLAACSNPVEKEDWSPGAPKVVFERDQAKGFVLIPVNDQQVPADGRIEFPGSPIESMKVSSNCKSDSIRKSMNNRSEVTLVKTNSVSLRNVLPDSIWKRLHFTSLGKVTCDLSFETKSALGSSWNFTIQKLTIDNLEKLANFDFKSLSEKNVIQPESKYDLICEYFVNAIDAPAGKRFNELYQNLAHAPVVDEKPQNGGDLSRLRFTSQKCRLAIETFDSSATRQRFLSEIFTQDFEEPKVEVSAGIQFMDSIVSLKNRRENVLNVTIRNLSMVHVAYRLHDLVSDNLMIQNVTRTGPDQYAVVENYPITLQYGFSGHSNLLEDGADRILEIAPGQTLHIGAIVTSGLECWDEGRWMKNEVQHGLQNPAYQISVGYQYAFTHRRFLSRLLNWDPGVADVTSPTRAVDILNAQSPDIDGHYPGLTFLRGWIEAGAPRDIKVTNHGLPELTYCGPQRFRMEGGGPFPTRDFGPWRR